MKKLYFVSLLMIAAGSSFAQKIDNIINATEVKRIETVLSSDNLKGRRTFTPYIDTAADFIASEFKKAGLQTWDNGQSYLQKFAMVKTRVLNCSSTINHTTIDAGNIVTITSRPQLTANEQSGYTNATIMAGANFFMEAQKLVLSGKNYFVTVDTSFAKNFGRLARFGNQLFKADNSVIFVLFTGTPSTWSVEATHEITEQKLANVVGILPGKSRKNEYVIFSGHYDHLGIGKPIDGDSIYNGANDDAAGTTAVIMLAKYFKQLNDNERTLVFTAFTAEEIGGFGSQYFSRQFNPDQVMAMFNIEMIGTESKWGRNSAYITGYEKTDMGKILQDNLQGTDFTFYPDPYTTQNLFYRSDNATLARLGVPAHTISTSKMDSEPNYHKPSDEISTLDMDNMVMIIKSIALSSKGIISGKETPSRVNTAELR